MLYLMTINVIKGIPSFPDEGVIHTKLDLHIYVIYLKHQPEFLIH